MSQSELSLNQELELKNFEYTVAIATREELQELALTLLKQLMQQQNATKDLFKGVYLDGELG